MTHDDPIAEDPGRFSRHFRAIASRHSPTPRDGARLPSVAQAGWAAAGPLVGRLPLPDR